MHHKHEFPTNAEMLDTFNQRGRDMFVAAFEHDLAHKMPDQYKEKKLGHLILDIIHVIDGSDAGLANPVTGEEIKMSVINVDDTSFIQRYYSERNTDIGEEMITEAQFFGDALLDDDFRPSIIGRRAVESNYEATLLNTKRKHKVGTFLKTPTKMVIASSIILQEEMLDYIKSTDFEVPYRVRMIGAIAHGAVGVDGFKPFSHRWKMPFRRGMTFNGFEPKNDLQRYLKIAVNYRDRSKARLQSLIDMNAPEFQIATEINYLDGLNTTIASAINALEKK